MSGKRTLVIFSYFSQYADDALTKNSPVSGASLKKVEIFYGYFDIFNHPHGSALEGSDPHELAGGFEVCQMKGTHIINKVKFQGAQFFAQG